MFVINSFWGINDLKNFWRWKNPYFSNRRGLSGESLQLKISSSEQKTFHCSYDRKDSLLRFLNCSVLFMLLSLSMVVLYQKFSPHMRNYVYLPKNSKNNLWETKRTFLRSCWSLKILLSTTTENNTKTVSDNNNTDRIENLTLISKWAEDVPLFS